MVNSTREFSQSTEEKRGRGETDGGIPGRQVVGPGVGGM